MSVKNILVTIILIFSISACTWVELTEEGEKARVLSASEVTSCTFVGKTTSSTTAKVIGVKRHDNAINDELVSLARNSAIRLGGDTVVADGPVEDGKQTFKVYRCIPR